MCSDRDIHYIKSVNILIDWNLRFSTLFKIGNHIQWSYISMSMPAKKIKNHFSEPTDAYWHIRDAIT